jgi:16S rRNA (guanine(966)-N(2))-methyltransferase RsmD
MRVIAGSLKGRRLDTPDWEGLRPTSDKLRETLFNVLAVRIGEARVLDGFAGTGAVGIEALSRGAAHVTFVEADGRAERLVRRNLDHCGVGADRYAIIRARFTDAARTLSARSFDLVFLDPPYRAADIAGTLAAAAPLVAVDGLVVLEHARRDVAPEAASIVKTRDILSGDSALTLYRACE